MVYIRHIFTYIIVCFVKINQYTHRFCVSIVDVPRILIITPIENDNVNFHLITSRFVGKTNHSFPIILDTYDGQNGTLVSGATNLFPNKMLNLQGRYFKVGLARYEPYTAWTSTVGFYSKCVQLFFLLVIMSHLILQFCDNFAHIRDIIQIIKMLHGLSRTIL